MANLFCYQFFFAQLDASLWFPVPTGFEFHVLKPERFSPKKIRKLFIPWQRRKSHTLSNMCMCT